MAGSFLTGSVLWLSTGLRHGQVSGRSHSACQAATSESKCGFLLPEACWKRCRGCPDPQSPIVGTWGSRWKELTLHLDSSTDSQCTSRKNCKVGDVRRMVATEFGRLVRLVMACLRRRQDAKCDPVLSKLMDQTWQLCFASICKLQAAAGHMFTRPVRKRHTGTDQTEMPNFDTASAVPCGKH